MTYTAHGKQVMHDGDHVADACDTGTALMIAEALNATNDAPRHPDLFSDRATVAHHVRQESDEYACSCGKRWDVADGEEHP